jgi:hypothetical protein
VFRVAVGFCEGRQDKRFLNYVLLHLALQRRSQRLATHQLEVQAVVAGVAGEGCLCKGCEEGANHLIRGNYEVFENRQPK